MKYAVTDYDGCEYITAGKRYEVISDWLDCFCIIDDENEKLYCKLEKCACINGNDWRIEMNNDIEQKGNDFEVKYDDETEVCADVQKLLDIINDHKCLLMEASCVIKSLSPVAHRETIKQFEDIALNKDYKYLVSQKQPEMSKSDVTRSDIDLRDYFAGQALQGMLAAGTDWYDVYESKCRVIFSLADAMMEARK